MTKPVSSYPKPSRRTVLGGLTATGVASSLPFGTAWAQNPPFRIGVLNTFTKAPTLGTGNLNGMNLYFDEIGWEVAGRKLEIVREDDEINPQVGLQKLRKLVESDKVDMISGPQASNVAMAILDYARRTKTFLLVSGAGATALAWQNMPYMFRSSTSTLQTCHPMGDWIYDNLTKELVMVSADFAGGRDVALEFKFSYLAKGGKILKEIYPPLNTTDYSPYLTDIRSIAPAATFNFLIGSDAVRYVQQYEQFGLKDKIKLTGFAVVDADTIPGQGKSALGAITTSIYTDTLNIPENTKFVAAFRAKYNAYPDFYSEYGYTAARVIVETLKATNGASSDKDQFAAAMAAVKFVAPRGPFSFDPATHNVIENVYIREAVEIDGRIANKVIATYPDVRVPPSKPEAGAGDK
jgi:branched-chain amino acid transport system substrate-binding protein